jgi:hypothetical protein
VREQWATEHGLTDIATDSFDRHLDAVWRELSVTDKCSELNRVHEAMKRGAERLGWSFTRITRNWDAARHDPAMAGYLGFGDQSGAKALHAEGLHGARRRRARPARRRRLLRREGARRGRTGAGVTGRWTAEDGSASAGRHRAGARGGGRGRLAGVARRAAAQRHRRPGAGDYLRLHPVTIATGDYGTDMQAWWGAPHAGLINEFANVEDGYGFLIESVQYTTGLGASSVPFTTGEEHKQAMVDLRNSASFIGWCATAGTAGSRSTPTAAPCRGTRSPTSWTSATRSGLRAQIRAHHAAGARGIQILAQGRPSWRYGDDLEAFIARARGCRCGPAAPPCSPRTRWAPAGWAPTRRRASPTRAANCTTPRGVDRRRLGVPHAVRNQPDDHHHGAGVPHRREHRRVDGRVRRRRSRKESVHDLDADPRSTGTGCSSAAKWVEPASSETIEVVNATTEEVMARVPAGGEPTSTAPSPPPGRLRRLGRHAAGRPGGAVHGRLAAAAGAAGRTGRADRPRDGLADPVLDRRADRPAVGDVRVDGPAVEDLPWEERLGNSMIVREPVGVVGAITPWNYPLHQVAAKVAPALVTGCTVVVKPSEVAPLSAFVLAEILPRSGSRRACSTW